MTPKLKPNVIGYDPGFGNTKVCIDGKVSVVQSAVSIPRQTGLAAIGLKAAGRKVRVVNINGHEFATGVGAGTRGQLKTSMDYSALSSLERRALFYSAAAEVLNGAMEDALLVVGLPVPLLEDREQAGAVLESLKQLKGEHTFEASHQSYSFSVGRIKVLAQPAGAYIDWAYDATLRVQARAGSVKSEVLVLDIGLNTLDIYVLKNGQVLESFIGGAEVGVKRLLELLTTNGHDLMEMDAELRSGALRPEAALLEGWLGEVLAAIKRTTPNLRRFDVVIPCGGGALVLGDRLRLALAAKGAAVHWPDNPVTTNVAGFYKYGLKTLG